MPKPGYKTSEHTITWAVILLSGFALFRGGNSLDRLSALLSPAIASAAYSHSRGRAKSFGPFDPKQLLAQQLTEAFRGRVATSARTARASGSVGEPTK